MAFLLVERHATLLASSTGNMLHSHASSEREEEGIPCGHKHMGILSLQPHRQAQDRAASTSRA